MCLWTEDEILNEGEKFKYQIVYEEVNVDEEFWDDTSEIINLRDVELPEYPEEDYDVHEYLEKEEF